MKIHVVGAAIIHKGKCLIAQRGLGMSSPGKWEFPGGKIEAHESAEKALAREVLEELNLNISVGQFLGRGTAEALTKTIDLDVYAARLNSGKLILHEHARVAWVTGPELADYDWAEADIPVLPRVAEFLQNS